MIVVVIVFAVAGGLWGAFAPAQKPKTDKPPAPPIEARCSPQARRLMWRPRPNQELMARWQTHLSSFDTYVRTLISTYVRTRISLCLLRILLGQRSGLPQRCTILGTCNG